MQPQPVWDKWGRETRWDPTPGSGHPKGGNGPRPDHGRQHGHIAGSTLMTSSNYYLHLQGPAKPSEMPLQVRVGMLVQLHR